MPCRVALLLSMVAIVPIGYIVRFSKGVFPELLHDVFGALAYEIFWVLLVQFWLPRSSVTKTAIGVCLATCAIEFLQLWQPPFLQAIRATLPGRLVLGNTFMWVDFPPYFVGSLLGWLWVSGLRRFSRQPKIAG